MMETVHTSEMSVYFNNTTRHYVQEGCNLHGWWNLGSEFRKTANCSICWWSTSHQDGMVGRHSETGGFMFLGFLSLSLFVEIYLHRLWPPNTGFS
jgi:hypothetical protein